VQGILLPVLKTLEHGLSGNPQRQVRDGHQRTAPGTAIPIGASESDIENSDHQAAVGQQATGTSGVDSSFEFEAVPVSFAGLLLQVSLRIRVTASGTSHLRLEGFEVRATVLALLSSCSSSLH
jgi:hypothetical protein